MVQVFASLAETYKLCAIVLRVAIFVLLLQRDKNNDRGRAEDNADGNNGAPMGKPNDC